ncbi:MAG: polysaccharide deacetylase family protein, partial [Halobacteriales archaeon]|nr:polysaccharide deacetylase family protein [Halobacteriales archaeon]
MPAATVCVTFDFDAVSLWLHTDPDRRSPANYSRGRFGAEVAAPRLLELLDELEVPSTWFIPGHTIESFPDPCEAVVAAGHEVAHHGWSHTRPSAFPSRSAERRDIDHGIAAIKDLTGKRPRGYRSPSWDHSANTVDILRDTGFEWDSSLMARDFVPEFVRQNWSAPPEGAYDPGEPTDLLELPVSWQRDDFPPLGYTGGTWVGDEAAV